MIGWKIVCYGVNSNEIVAEVVGNCLLEEGTIRIPVLIDKTIQFAVFGVSDKIKVIERPEKDL